MYRYPLVWLQLYLTNGTYEKLEHISNRILRIQPAFNSEKIAKSYLQLLLQKFGKKICVHQIAQHLTIMLN